MPQCNRFDHSDWLCLFGHFINFANRESSQSAVAAIMAKCHQGVSGETERHEILTFKRAINAAWAVPAMNNLLRLQNIAPECAAPFACLWIGWNRLKQPKPSCLAGSIGDPER